MLLNELISTHFSDIVGMSANDGTCFELREEVLGRKFEIRVETIKPVGQVFLHSLEILAVAFEGLEGFWLERVKRIAVAQLRRLAGRARCERSTPGRWLLVLFVLLVVARAQLVCSFWVA